MIVHLQKNTPLSALEVLQKKHYGVYYRRTDGVIVAVLGASYQKAPAEVSDYVVDTWVMDSNIQLASRHYQAQSSEIDLGFAKIGGKTANTVLIAGPCSVESRTQIQQTAQFLKTLSVRILRAGCYKPRTSPYAFQGLEKKGLALLDEVRQKHGLRIITEAKDASHIQDVIRCSDIIQIGAKAMYDHALLTACGKTTKPVLIKRGFGTTLQEFIQAAEFVLSKGNPNVILCERGIRTFETKTRFTLDLCGVAYLKAHVHLPVVVDPSHAMGHAYGVPELARAAIAMGIDGLLIEVHPTPKKALSDPNQQLNFTQLEDLVQSLQPIARAVQRHLI